MRCESCGARNREEARFCDVCGIALGFDATNAQDTTLRHCTSCGRVIDLGVYYTMCPHCGFNYRIEITPMKPHLASSRRSVAFLSAVSAIVPFAGFIIGALLWKDANSKARRLANMCLCLAAINVLVAPILIVRFFGMT